MVLSSFTSSGAGTAQDGYLAGSFLVAMPGMLDPRFDRTVIYLCAHDANGAMGFVVNRLSGNLDLRALLSQIQQPTTGLLLNNPRVYHGGPVEPGRGFILHSLDYRQENTFCIGDDVGVTATIDLLDKISQGVGPKQALITLGYTGWAAGQLDTELLHNGWLNAPGDAELLFSSDNDLKWERAVSKIGIRLDHFSGAAGHA
jgi:putative transcriptional regulator